jgi:hypothetical protein
MCTPFHGHRLGKDKISFIPKLSKPFVGSAKLSFIPVLSKSCCGHSSYKVDEKEEE